MNLISVAGGLTIFAVNLLLIKKRSHWDKTHTILNLIAGMGLVVITYAILHFGIFLITKVVVAVSKPLGGVPILPTVLSAIPTALPWITGAILLVWLVVDMWPKKGRTDRPTAWVALFVPAGFALLPPLAAATGLA